MQEIVGVTTDGLMGPVTLGAVQSYDGRTLFLKLMAHRLTFLTRLVSRDTSQVSFIYGWGKRLAKILDVAA
jgi:lysozyme family protein